MSDPMKRIPFIASLAAAVATTATGRNIASENPKVTYARWVKVLEELEDDYPLDTRITELLDEVRQARRYTGR